MGAPGEDDQPGLTGRMGLDSEAFGRDGALHVTGLFDETRLADLRALDDTLAMATRYAETAKAALADFPVGPWREAMKDLADFAVSRTK